MVIKEVKETIFFSQPSGLIGKEFWDSHKISIDLMLHLQEQERL